MDRPLFCLFPFSNHLHNEMWAWSFVTVVFFFSLQSHWRLVAAGFIIQPIWHLVHPERQTYSAWVSPVGWRLWLARDVLHYWSDWLLPISLSYYTFTAAVLVGSVVFSSVVPGMSSLLWGLKALEDVEKKQGFYTDWFSLNWSVKRQHRQGLLATMLFQLSHL